MTMQFDTVIDKTEKGFGIIFAKVSVPENSGDQHFLVVDGFVDAAKIPLETGQSDEGVTILQLGDILTKVNGEDCQRKEVTDVLDLLRAADVGPNKLSFLRNESVKPILNEETKPDGNLATFESGAPKSRLMGAFLKVKSKIQSEIDGEEDLREKLEDELFEKRWLEEFEVLKKQYETKWETCTYTADEFCGLLYRSSDAQQKEHLLKEYPTLMEAWKNNRVSSTSRVIPEWPAVKLVYDNAVDYNPTDCTSINPRIIECSQSLQTVLECLRVEFMWRSDDLRAFGRSLDVAGISSCSALLEALDVRSHHFERNFQSIEYPRLSKTILRVLRENTQKMMDIPSNKTGALALMAT